MSAKQITQDDIKNARHQGFSNATAHMGDERRRLIATSYIKQDDRRTRNVRNFVEGVRGQKA